MLLEFEILIKAVINIIAALLLTYVLFYRRYHNKELFVSSMLLNICVFCVMSIISEGNIGLQAGLGLFAILSILRFRSETFKKMEMAYFFGAVAIAAVNGIGKFGVVIVVANILILATAFIFDGKYLMLPANQLQVCLDSIPAYIFDKERTKKELSDQFNIEIIRFDISSIDYVKDTVVLDLYFNERHPIQEILELDPSNHPAER